MIHWLRNLFTEFTGTILNYSSTNQIFSYWQNILAYPPSKHLNFIRYMEFPQLWPDHTPILWPRTFFQAINLPWEHSGSIVTWFYRVHPNFIREPRDSIWYMSSTQRDAKYGFSVLPTEFCFNYPPVPFMHNSQLDQKLTTPIPHLAADGKPCLLGDSGSTYYLNGGAIPPPITSLFQNWLGCK